MSKPLLIVLAAGVASALASLSMATGSVLALLMMYVAPLPLLLAGLALGPRLAALAAAAGFAVTGLLGGTAAAAVFGLLHAAPAWVVVRQALAYRTAPDGTIEWSSPGGIVAWLALMAAAMVAGAATALSGGDGLEAAVQASLDQAFRQLSLPDPLREGWLDILVPLFPGFAGSAWVVTTVANAALAQALLARSGRALRPSPAFADLTLPDWASVGLVAVAGLAVAATAIEAGELRYLGRNLAVVLMVPFFFQGLAVVHAMARRSMNGTMLLAAFYLLVLVFDGAKLLVAGVGVFEQWVGIRRRFAGPVPARKPDDGEEE
ncbi:MAG: DUF2232 domain-containing protein [Magnetospirillum sp. WYHS-4]